MTTNMPRQLRSVREERASAFVPSEFALARLAALEADCDVEWLGTSEHGALIQSSDGRPCVGWCRLDEGRHSAGARLSALGQKRTSRDKSAPLVMLQP